jgi:hypothetical protein
VKSSRLWKPFWKTAGSVLTLAYSVQDEKPQAVEDAIRTMDDLIWSVKPKITMPERQELLRRLPAILARLNKWLSLIKWDDADRIRFFAELAECHASIVRAPLELSPDRQLELAVEAAQRAAERRLEKRAEAERKSQEEQVAQQESSQDPYVQLVEQLERGIWLALQRDGLPEPVRVRLAWVSPMRSLYIFTTVQKDQTFSLSTQEVQQAFRSGQARLLEVEKNGPRFTGSGATLAGSRCRQSGTGNTGSHSLMLSLPFEGANDSYHLLPFLP